MKKQYSAPEIYFESFIMSTSIAGDCEAPFVKTVSKNSCGIPADFGPDILFNVIAGSKCNAPGDNDGLYDGLCYHNPTDNNNMFNS